MGAASAAVASSLALGLQRAFDTGEPAPIVIPDPGGEPPPDDIVVFFHPQVPEATLVLVRWSPRAGR